MGVEIDQLLEADVQVAGIVPAVGADLGAESNFEKYFRSASASTLAGFFYLDPEGWCFLVELQINLGTPNLDRMKH